MNKNIKVTVEAFNLQPGTVKFTGNSYLNPLDPLDLKIVKELNKNSIMYVLCAWCGRDLGTKPAGDYRLNLHTTHGICKRCVKRINRLSSKPYKCLKGFKTWKKCRYCFVGDCLIGQYNALLKTNMKIDCKKGIQTKNYLKSWHEVDTAIKRVVEDHLEEIR